MTSTLAWHYTQGRHLPAIRAACRIMRATLHIPLGVCPVVCITAAPIAGINRSAMDIDPEEHVFKRGAWTCCAALDPAAHVIVEVP